jgi:hypothetical protein
MARSGLSFDDAEARRNSDVIARHPARPDDRLRRAIQ